MHDEKVASVGNGSKDIISFLPSCNGREAMSTCRCNVVVVDDDDVDSLEVVLLLLLPLLTDATISSPYIPISGRSYFPVQVADMPMRSMVMDGLFVVESNIDDDDEDVFIDATPKFVHTIS